MVLFNCNTKELERKSNNIQFCVYRIQAPELPTWQDCHELWSKKRKRQIREQQESTQNLPPGKPPVSQRPEKSTEKIEENEGG